MVTEFIFHLGYIGFWTFIVKGMMMMMMIIIIIIIIYLVFQRSTRVDIEIVII